MPARFRQQSDRWEGCEGNGTRTPVEVMGCPFKSLMNPAIGAPMAALRTAAANSLFVFTRELLPLTA